jgi:hypothetical protein
LKKASQKEVIQIPADEEKISFEKTVENEQLKYEIAKAQLTGNRFNVILAATKYFMPVPSQQRDQTMKDYIHQYFLQNAKISITDGYFFPRIDIGLFANPGRVY